MKDRKRQDMQDKGQSVHQELALYIEVGKFVHCVKTDFSYRSYRYIVVMDKVDMNDFYLVSQKLEFSCVSK